MVRKVRSRVVQLDVGSTDTTNAFEMFKALMDVMQALYNDLWLNGLEPALGSYTFTKPEMIEKMTRTALGKLVK